MAGKIKRIVDEIIEKKSKGNATLKITTRTKIILKGINPDKYNFSSPDDPVVLKKLEIMAKELGVTIH